MANFAVEKYFLDQSGLQTLVKKVAGVKTDLESLIGDALTDANDLKLLVNEIINWKSGLDHVAGNSEAKGILAQVIADAVALREEIGDKP